MTISHQALIEKITDDLHALPENMAQEVLDFIGYLRTKYEPNDRDTRQEALLATFNSWQDDRDPDEIVQEIYATRTLSEPKLDIQ